MPGKHVDSDESLEALQAVAMAEMTVSHIPKASIHNMKDYFRR
jgi:hypothetical protein